jgi:hypothetical protein
MFLIRSLFWLMVVVLMLPPAGEAPAPRVGLYETALAARALVHDVAGLCERNEEACATSRDAADLFGRKLETGARMVGSAFGERSEAPQGSLTAADMAEPWSLPQPRDG